MYNILYPVFLFFVFFLSIFNKKIRIGLAGRFESIHILNEYFSQHNIKFSLSELTNVTTLSSWILLTNQKIQEKK